MSTWRIPTDEDFKAIEAHLGMSQSEADSTGFRGTNEGSALAGGWSLWDSGALRDDARFGETGVDILPAGHRDSNSVFDRLGERGTVWSTTNFPDSTTLYWRALFSFNTAINRSTSQPKWGYSLRLLRDDNSEDADGAIYTDDYTGNDGKKYDAVKIGNFTIINENLNETKYADGTEIPIIEDATEWGNTTSGARCYYNNDEETYGSTYGALYNGHIIESTTSIIREEEGNGDEFIAPIRRRPMRSRSFRNVTLRTRYTLSPWVKKGLSFVREKKWRTRKQPQRVARKPKVRINRWRRR